MARSLGDTVAISCALTGSIHTPSMSEHLPITPDEIIEEGIKAAEAGAAIIHIHARDPETGEPVSDIDLFKEIAGGIKAETDAIIQPTTGGGHNQTVEERFAVVSELEPEMASFNTGSMNFGLYHMKEAVDEFKYDWEAEYLENSRDHIFPNTFKTQEGGLEMFDQAGTKPELECYSISQLYNAKHMLDRGYLDPPIHIQFVMGILGGIGRHEQDLANMIETTERLFGDQASWSVLGAGRKEFPFAVNAVSTGGNVRVGLEDNLYLSRGKRAKSNAELVEKMVELAWEVGGREPAEPSEVREFLGLKGQNEVGF